MPPKDLSKSQETTDEEIQELKEFEEATEDDLFDPSVWEEKWCPSNSMME